MIEYAEVHKATTAIIPSLYELVGNASFGTRTTAFSVFDKMIEKVELRYAIGVATPVLFKMFRHKEAKVRSTVILALEKIAEHTSRDSFGCHSVIYSASG